jgi:vacuolar-type H+-ATPase subunit H
MTTNMSDGTSKADVARDEASRVASNASEKAGEVASTAIEQAKEVAAEATTQAKNLVQELRTQADDQAIGQRDRLVETLRSVGDELESMVQSSDQSGMASDLVNQVAQRVQGAAGYLESKKPADLFTDLKSFARQRPGAFLVGAAVAGMVAGRLTRGARAASSDGGQPVSATTPVPGYEAVGMPTYPTAPAYPTGYEQTSTYATDPYSTGAPVAGSLGDDGHIDTESDLAWTSSSAGGTGAASGYDDLSNGGGSSSGQRAGGQL